MVTAVNKEVLTGTPAEISCNVTGLTAALQTVKWEKSDGTDVTTGKTGFSSQVKGIGDGSQVTTLTVASAHNTVDTTYKCLVTPSTQDDTSEVSTNVKLNVFCKRILVYVLILTNLKRSCN